jgi:hypothetical protein
MSKSVKESPLDRALRVVVIAMLLLASGCCGGEVAGLSCREFNRDHLDDCHVLGLMPGCHYLVFATTNDMPGAACDREVEVTAGANGSACILRCETYCPPASCISCPNGNCP